MSNNKCSDCGNMLEKNHVALNRKIIDRDSTRFLCIDCLAQFLDCTREDLLVKIEEFKEQGCSLFD